MYVLTGRVREKQLKTQIVDRLTFMYVLRVRGREKQIKTQFVDRLTFRSIAD